jgi:hypothetical protein
MEILMRRRYGMLDAMMDGNQSMENAVAIPVETASNQVRNSEVETQIAKLTLVTMAMWQLLREKTGVTETELAERVAILDAQDGVADGALTRRPKQCSKCHRIVERKQSICLYCGTQQQMESVFDNL